MPIEPQPGEIWFADLGMVEKSRPVLVLAYPQPADARALVIVAPLTSQIGGLRGEVSWASRDGCQSLRLSTSKVWRASILRNSRGGLGSFPPNSSPL